MKKKTAPKKKVDKNVTKIESLQVELRNAESAINYYKELCRQASVEKERLNDRIGFNEELNQVRSDASSMFFNILEKSKSDMMEIVRWQINSSTTNHPFKPSINQIPPSKNSCDQFRLPDMLR